jgi:DNA-directed RNA polymerase specialized sigma24 family protein
MNDEILDLLILGGYSFKEVSELLGVSVSEVRAIYSADICD